MFGKKTLALGRWGNWPMGVWYPVPPKTRGLAVCPNHFWWAVERIHMASLPPTSRGQEAPHLGNASPRLKSKQSSSLGREPRVPQRGGGHGFLRHSSVCPEPRPRGRAQLLPPLSSEGRQPGSLGTWPDPAYIWRKVLLSVVRQPKFKARLGPLSVGRWL